ncbi:MAG: efflux transporter outer membrane subunit [Serpentinimonas sp.]|nr:efflux transporter outer membrane subunit [Serpentinimonas sp.]
MTDRVPVRLAAPGRPKGLRLRALATASALLFLAGCSQMEPYQRPASASPDALPTAWPTAPVVAVPGAASASGTPQALRWQDWITDARLRTLVDSALANNRDARIAALQARQLQAQLQIREAARLPSVNAGVTGSRQTVGENEPLRSEYTAGLQVPSWEIDFFGRLASLRDAALGQYLASEEAVRSAQLSLVSSVASGWLGLQATDAQLALTRQTLASREEALRLVRLRYDNGAASALDLRQAESLAETARVALAQQQRQRAQQVNALTLLVGQPLNEALPAQALQPQGDALAAVAEVPVGLPSVVLLERPDIRAAEQQLMAANAQIGAARAAFFPRISLTASFGSASSELSGLLRGGSWGWALAPQALLPLFDGGANRAGLESAQAGRELAVAQYERAIQSAFREVNDALMGRGALEEELRAQQALANAESERLRLSELRLREGVASQLEVLDAQRSLFAAQQALLQTRFALAQNRVDLYRATGGY